MVQKVVFIIQVLVAGLLHLANLVFHWRKADGLKDWPVGSRTKSSNGS